MATDLQSLQLDHLARQLAALTGEDTGRAVVRAVEERIDRLDERRARLKREARNARLDELFESIRANPLENLDPRTDDEILGYNEFGAFD